MAQSGHFARTSGRLALVGRFRELVAYDEYGWLAHTGPFTEEEQDHTGTENYLGNTD